MANTTNFGWETPDDTDLVKDGAAAMRTLGQAIDTSLVDLKGGTTDQVLAKNSNTDMDFKWVTSDDANAIQNSIIDAKGDLIVGSAADTPARLAVGTNGYTLVADSSTSTGLKWEAPAAGGGLTLLQTMTLSGSSTTSSTIAGTYKNLLIFVKGAYASTDSDLNMRFNSDTGSNYGRFRIRNSDGTVSGTSQNAQTLIEVSSLKNSATATDQVYGVVNVYRYADTDISYFDFTFYSRWSNQLNQYVGNGYYDQSAAISTVTFIPGSGTFSGGSVYIYGVS